MGEYIDPNSIIPTIAALAPVEAPLPPEGWEEPFNSGRYRRTLSSGGKCSTGHFDVIAIAERSREILIGLIYRLPDGRYAAFMSGHLFVGFYTKEVHAINNILCAYYG